MPFSSGTFSVVYNWTTESGASPIEIAKLDTQHADFATGLSNCILRDGTGLPTAAIPFNSQNITGVAELQAARFVPTASTVPTNGMYLSAANTVAFASNTTLRAAVNSAGNWTFAAPSSGASIASQGPITVTISGITQTIGTDGTGPFLDIAGANSWRLFTNSTQRLTVGSAGNVTIAAPSSGTALTVTSASGAYASTLSSGGSALSAGYNIGLLSNAWNLHTTGTDPFVFGTISAATASLYTDSTQRILIGTAGNVTINAPSSGNALTVNGFAAIDTGAITQSFQEDGSGALLDISGSNNWRIYTGGSERIRVGNAGNVTINAPSSGTALAVNGVTGTLTDFSDGTRAVRISTDVSNVYIGASTNHPLQFITNNTAKMAIAAAGNVTINAASSGDELTVTGSVVATSFAGTMSGDGSALTALNATQLTSGTVPTARITSVETTATIDSVLIGFRSIPQSSQSANYTLVLTDSGRDILHPSGGGAGDTFTIPANASVAFPVGTVITFTNLDSNAVSIAITTDTMTIAGTTTTGTRTLGQNGQATARKVTTTSWLISGVGLS